MIQKHVPTCKHELACLNMTPTKKMDYEGIMTTINITKIIHFYICIYSFVKLNLYYVDVKF